MDRRNSRRGARGSLGVVAVDSEVHSMADTGRAKGVSRFADAFFGTMLALVMIGIGAWFLPASFWFDVRNVQVLDTVHGASPAMVIERTIHRPFTADWTVSVLRISEDGTSAYCSVEGHNDYVPGAVIPPGVNLDWWTWPERCELEVGQYVVRTLWEIRLFGFLSKDIRITSNPFNVFAVASTGVRISGS